MKSYNCLIRLALCCLLAACGREQKPTSKTPELRPEAPLEPAASDGRPLSPPPSQTGVLPEGYSSWSELEASDPEARHLFAFDGVDPVEELLGGEARCSVYFQTRVKEADGKERWILRTSFAHLEERPQSVVLNEIKPTDLNLSGQRERDELSVFGKLAEAGQALSLQKLQVKWFHINHYDTFVCENLRLRNP